MQRRTSLVLGLVTLTASVLLALTPVYSGAKHGAQSAGIPIAAVAVGVSLLLVAGLTLLVRGLRRG